MYVQAGEIVSVTGWYLTQIVSGYVLIWAVYTVFKYLHNTEN